MVVTGIAEVPGQTAMEGFLADTHPACLKVSVRGYDVGTQTPLPKGWVLHADMVRECSVQSKSRGPTHA